MRIDPEFHEAYCNRDVEKKIDRIEFHIHQISKVFWPATRQQKRCDAMLRELHKRGTQHGRS